MNKIEHGYCPNCGHGSVYRMEFFDKSLVCSECGEVWHEDIYHEDVDKMRDSVSYAIWEVGQRRRDLFMAIWNTIDPLLAYPIGKLADGINKLSSWIRKMESKNE